MFGFLASVALLAVQTGSPPARNCPVRYATRYATSLGDLPAQVKADILKSGAIADTGEPFEGTDVILDRQLPRRQFVTAGSSNDRWFVVIDHGGFDRHIDVIGYIPLLGKSGSFTWHRNAVLQGDPCIAINAFLDGVWTPASSRH
ncbi:hypothetical protein ABS767_16075 [Sphingomonas sp. ST-64]|uniref:Uncharacterized protein n=1 Tax=Sphingomonas plantiphila TaxID=3163295 RepID=A0ABW8YQD3_9SPHN